MKGAGCGSGLDLRSIRCPLPWAAACHVKAIFAVPGPTPSAGTQPFPWAAKTQLQTSGLHSCTAHEQQAGPHLPAGQQGFSSWSSLFVHGQASS